MKTIFKSIRKTIKVFILLFIITTTAQAQTNTALSPIKRGDKWGFVDKTGKEVVPCKYDAVTEFSESLARVSLNGKVGFIDKAGKEVTPLKYEYVDLKKGLSEGLAGVKLNGKWGFVDKTGKEVIPLIYDAFVDEFSEGKAKNSVIDFFTLTKMVTK